MKLTTGSGFHTLQLEPGETLHVVFDPRGNNAIPGGDLIQALFIGTLNLPNGDMALTLGSDTDSRYHAENGRAVFYDGRGAEELKFVLNAEAPRIELKLVKLSA